MEHRSSPLQCRRSAGRPHSIRRFIPQRRQPPKPRFWFIASGIPANEWRICRPGRAPRPLRPLRPSTAATAHGSATRAAGVSAIARHPWSMSPAVHRGAGDAASSPGATNRQRCRHSTETMSPKVTHWSCETSPSDTGYPSMACRTGTERSVLATGPRPSAHDTPVRSRPGHETGLVSRGMTRHGSANPRPRTRMPFGNVAS